VKGDESRGGTDGGSGTGSEGRGGGRRMDPAEDVAEG